MSVLTPKADILMVVAECLLMTHSGHVTTDQDTGTAALPRGYAALRAARLLRRRLRRRGPLPLL